MIVGVILSRERVLTLSTILALAIQPLDGQGSADALFSRGRTWDQFLGAAKAQRTQWLHAAADADVEPDVLVRVDRVSRNLRLLVVAEDWCPDSVNAVPYIAKLASRLSIPLRIVDRETGISLMRRHRTPDGRVATPTVVVLRGALDVGAWVERPAVMQAWFLSMATSPDSARRFSARQAWYDADHGHTVLAELTALVERSTEQ